MQNNKMQLASAADYLLQDGTSDPSSYNFSNDTFSNTDDGSLPPTPSISCPSSLQTFETPFTGLECLTTDNCGCPPGAAQFTSLPTNHTVGINEVHCLQNSQVLTGSGLTVHGTLYITNNSILELPGGYSTIDEANLVVCPGSGLSLIHI